MSGSSWTATAAGPGRWGWPAPAQGTSTGPSTRKTCSSWCERAGIKHVTVFACSAENLQRRSEAEVAVLMTDHRDVVTDPAGPPRGQLAESTSRARSTCCPATTARALKEAAEATRECTTGAHLTLAIGYGGRQEVARRDPRTAVPSTQTPAAHSLAWPNRAHCRRHRPPPVHRRAPRPRSGHPHQRRAAHVQLPALAERATQSCISATPTGPRSAKSAISAPPSCQWAASRYRSASQS